MKKILTATLIFSCINAFATPAGDLNLTAHSLKFKIYKVAVSTSANCTSPVVVIDNGTAGIETDVKLPNPQFGAGNIDDGTYPCVMLEASDTIKYSGENSASGNCSPSNVTERSLCHDGDTSQALDGTTINCVDGDNKVVFYLSTNTVASPSGNGFIPPAGGGSQDGGHLATALTVADGAIARLSVKTDGFLCDNENDTGSDCDGAGDESPSADACRLENAEFVFSKL